MLRERERTEEFGEEEAVLLYAGWEGREGRGREMGGLAITHRLYGCSGAALGFAVCPYPSLCIAHGRGKSLRPGGREGGREGGQCEGKPTVSNFSWKSSSQAVKQGDYHHSDLVSTAVLTPRCLYAGRGYICCVYMKKGEKARQGAQVAHQQPVVEPCGCESIHVNVW